MTLEQTCSYHNVHPCHQIECFDERQHWLELKVRTKGYIPAGDRKELEDLRILMHRRNRQLLDEVKKEEGKKT